MTNINRVHEFDLALCRHLRDNIQAACRAGSILMHCREAFNDEMLARLDLLGDDRQEDSAVPFTLTTEEITEVTTDAACVAERARWGAYPQLYRRAVFCVPAIRNGLTRRDAEEWSAAVHRYATRLCARELSFGSGCEALAAWISTARRYQLAMSGNYVSSVKDMSSAMLGREPKVVHERADSFSPPQLAEKLRVSPNKIHAWIKSGELRATNVSGKPGGRHRYRISLESLQAFERRRTVGVTPAIANRRRRKSAGDYTEFFKPETASLNVAPSSASARV